MVWVGHGWGLGGVPMLLVGSYGWEGIHAVDKVVADVGHSNMEEVVVAVQKPWRCWLLATVCP